MRSRTLCVRVVAQRRVSSSTVERITRLRRVSDSQSPAPFPCNVERAVLRAHPAECEEKAALRHDHLDVHQRVQRLVAGRAVFGAAAAVEQVRGFVATAEEVVAVFAVELVVAAAAVE